MKLATRALVPVAAIALLAGCATPSGGTAFEVNGTSTRLTAIDDAANDCVSLSGGQLDLAQIKTTVAQMLLSGEVAHRVAEATGTSITEAERDAEITKQQAGGFAKSSKCSQAISGFIDYTLVTNKLGAPKMLDEVKKLDVQVNPRFGAWRPEKGNFTNESGSLSREDLGLGKVFGG